MKREMQKAYDTLTPTEEQRGKMLVEIRSRLAEEPPERSEEMGRKPLSRMLTAALIAAALLALGITAYAEGWFGLRDLAESEYEYPKGFTREEILEREKELQEAIARGEDPEKKLREMDERDFPRPLETHRITFLAGLQDSPEAKAFQEYMAFLAEYDPDRSILRSVGNRPTGLEEEYGAYTCYTREMADKVDEICEKYGLRKLGPNKVLQNARQLYAYAGTGDFAPKDDHWSGQKLYPIAAYADGSFHADGALPQGSWTDYQIARCMKGTFTTSGAMELGDLETWTEWSYTTENGVELLLAQNGRRALILADRPESFVIVSMRGSYKAATQQATLEELAECFDFTAIP